MAEDQLSLAQVVLIRDKARAILVDKELTKAEKIGQVMVLCHDDKKIGVNHFSIDALRSLIDREWGFLMRFLE